MGGECIGIGNTRVIFHRVLTRLRMFTFNLSWLAVGYVFPSACTKSMPNRS